MIELVRGEERRMMVAKIAAMKGKKRIMMSANKVAHRLGESLEKKESVHHQLLQAVTIGACASGCGRQCGRSIPLCASDETSGQLGLRWYTRHTRHTRHGTCDGWGDVSTTWGLDWGTAWGREGGT